MIVEAACAVLVIGTLLCLLRQPYVVGYLIAGVLLGSHVLTVISDTAALSRVGDFGVVLLLFFVGMEVSLPRLVSSWRVAVLGTAFQILVRVRCAVALGSYLSRPLNRIVLVGFVVSLSSTAVVFKLLQDWGEFDTAAGRNTVGILLVQDVAIIPMLTVLSLLSGGQADAGQLALQALGATVCLSILLWVGAKGTVHLPMRRLLSGDHETQVFSALAICFGLVTVATIALTLVISPLWICAARKAVSMPPHVGVVAGAQPLT